ncbi:outer membrane protein assembly factor BamB family protein, partial [Flavobacterium oreochromis]
MFKLDKIINKLKSFLLKKNELLYCNFENKLFQNNLQIDIILDSDNYDIIENQLICTIDNNTIINGNKFENKGFLRNSYDNISSTFLLDSDFLLEYPNYSSSYFLFNIKNNEIEFLLRYYTLKKILNKGKLIFFSKGKQVDCYSSNSKTILWQTDISQIGKHIPFPDEEEKEGEVKNFVGVYNNELIVQLTGGKFIGLDLENGKVNWEQNLVENNLTNQVIDYNFGDPYNPFLDEENGKIYILQGEVFIVFDLLTKKATYQWSSLNLPTEDYVFIRQSNIYNNQIVFSAFRKGN